MSNINDYASHYKDVSLTDEGFNDLDAMLLTQFSSFHMNDIGVNQDSRISVREAASRLKESGTITNKNQIELINALCQSKRYEEIYLSDFVENNIVRNDPAGQTIEQFGAITCSFRDPSTGRMQRYIAYEATDGTLEGWEEDFYLSFRYGTEAQKRSKEYLEKIASKYDGDIMLGGHSKGGNDAMYAFLECDKSVANRITSIKLYDPPGFSEDISRKDRYQEMLEKIGNSTYAPFDSVIGLLMLGNKKPIFISTTKGIVEDHDFYSWEVDVNNKSFIEKDQSFFSVYLDVLFDEIVIFLPNYVIRCVI